MNASLGAAAKALALAVSAVSLAVAVAACGGEGAESAGRVPSALILEGGRLSRIVDGVALSFSVPAEGWTPGPIARLPDDAPWFRKGNLYISKDTVGPQGAEAVVFWTSFPDSDDADPCDNLLSPPVGPSAADLAAAVATATGTELVAGPTDVTVGGHSATHVVVTVREDVGCDPGFFYAWHDERWGPFWAYSNVGDTIRVWIVDVNGTRVFIAGETTAQASSRLEHEIQQIVESISFD